MWLLIIQDLYDSRDEHSRVEAMLKVADGKQILAYETLERYSLYKLVPQPMVDFAFVGRRTRTSNWSLHCKHR